MRNFVFDEDEKHYNIDECYDWTKKKFPSVIPAWCADMSGDSSVTPMSADDRIAYFLHLVKLGFKEIDLGSSDADYEFARKLIEEKLIPFDVSIQLRAPATKEGLERAESILDSEKNSFGAKKPLVMFEPCSSEEAVDCARIFSERMRNLRFGLSVKIPSNSGLFSERYSGAESRFVESESETINSVLDALSSSSMPRGAKPVIELYENFESLLPHEYATYAEYVSKNMHGREGVILSVRPRNERRTGIASAELSLLAGCDRIEGVTPGYFNHNLCNLYYVATYIAQLREETGLDISLMHDTESREKHKPRFYYERRPDSGDANVTRESMNKDDVCSFLEKKFGFMLPECLRVDLLERLSRDRRDFSTEEVAGIFDREYVNVSLPLAYSDVKREKSGGDVNVSLTLFNNGKKTIAKGEGNGTFNAAVDALKRSFAGNFLTVAFSEHALDVGSHSRAAAYVGLECEDKTYYAVGVDTDIMTASIKALVGAVNKILVCREKRN